jgi:tol-pal system protein YbgF
LLFPSICFNSFSFINLKIMRTSLKFVVLVGVALSAAPIFSSVFAQQAGSGADLFLDMQGMRAEIAELRDMVERQQYQMEKLQRKLGQQGGQSPSVAGPQTYNNSQIQSQQGYQVPPSATIDGSAPQYSENSAVSDSPSDYSDQAPFPASSTINSTGSSVSSSGSTADSTPAAANHVNQNYVDPNDAYRPNETGSVNSKAGVFSSSEYPVMNSIPVEERKIGATKLPAPGGDFAPVSEHSIGGPENNSDPEAQASIEDAGFVGNEQVANTQYPIDASGFPQSPSTIQDSVRLNRSFGVSNVPRAVPSQGGFGVIAIPNNRVSSTDANGSTVPVGGSQSRVSVGSPQQTDGDQPQTANAESAGLSEQDYYQRGFALLKASKHSQAINIFKQQISSYPQGSYADDAHYWIAESLYVNRALDDSKQYFRSIIDNYSQSPRLPDAMLKTAYIEQQQDNVIESRILLQEIIQYHPRSNAAISAKNRLPELK